MEKFDDLITSNIPVLVDFYAEWCGPCKMMKPILEDVKAMKGEKVRVVKVDVDKHQELAAYYQIQSVPTLMIFRALQARRACILRPLQEERVRWPAILLCVSAAGVRDCNL